MEGKMQKFKIMLGILIALLFGFGVYCALAAIGLNAGISFIIGWTGFAVAIMYVDEYMELKDKLAEIEQAQKEEAAKNYVQYQLTFDSKQRGNSQARSSNRTTSNLHTRYRYLGRLFFVQAICMITMGVLIASAASSSPGAPAGITASLN
jgi:hypothetical protein